MRCSPTLLGVLVAGLLAGCGDAATSDIKRASFDEAALPGYEAIAQWSISEGIDGGFGCKAPEVRGSKGHTVTVRCPKSPFLYFSITQYTSVADADARMELEREEEPEDNGGIEGAVCNGVDELTRCYLQVGSYVIGSESGEYEPRDGAVRGLQAALGWIEANI